jgi:hypothetical protein
MNNKIVAQKHKTTKQKKFFFSFKQYNTETQTKTALQKSIAKKCLVFLPGVSTTAAGAAAGGAGSAAGGGAC